MKKIVHIITGLNNGGAEMMLYKLLLNIDKSKYNIEVISMTDDGVFADKIRELDIKVTSLNMKRGIPSLRGIFKSVQIVKGSDFVQTWMYHADLFGFIVCKIAGIKNIIWGIHHSNLDKDKNKRLVLIIAKINSYLSRYTYKIVSCSNYATNIHVSSGYDQSKFVNIPNGFDLDLYFKVKNAKEDLCNELNIDKDSKIICHVARWDILKDYKTLIKSLSIVNEKYNNIKFILCGPNIDNDNEELSNMLKNKGINEDTLLLGRRTDIPKIMSASDILVLSSSGEAFPNVIGEAMACETPCVVTDVGDCKFIVDKYGAIAEKQNPKSLAIAIESILDLSNDEIEELGKNARNRVINNFDIHTVVKMYVKLYY